MAYVHVAYGGVNSTGTLTFTNSSVRNGSGLRCTNSVQCHVTHSIIENNITTALSCGGVNCTLNNLTIRHNNGVGISVGVGDMFEVGNNLVEGNSGHGITFNYSGNTQYSLYNNAINDNGGIAIFTGSSSPTYKLDPSNIRNNSGSGNDINGIRLLGYIRGTLNNSNPNFPYVLDATGYPSPSRQVHVLSGDSLTIEPGVVIKSDTDSYASMLNVNGTVTAIGTSESPIHLTSLEDDSVGGDTNNNGTATQPTVNDWRGIEIADTGVVNLDYVHVAYSGINSRGNLTFIHSSVRDTNSTGIRNETGGALFVDSSTFYRNRSGGIYNSPTNPIVQAKNSWWGSDSGPAPFGSGNGINYKRCLNNDGRTYYICEYYVDTDPWQGKSNFVKLQLGSSGPARRYQAYEADPVNTANGNYSYSYADILVATRGLPLAWSRSYNALIPEASPLGWGWTHSWNMNLITDTTPTAVVTFGDGHAEKWTWNGSGYDGTAGVFGLLVKNGDGTHLLTQKDQTRFFFDTSGRLAYVEDKNSNRTTLTYDGQNRLNTITEPAGRTLTLAYNSPVSSTLVSSVTDPLGRVVLYSYSAAGNLTSVQDVTGQATTVTYDANHRLLTITDANNHTFITNTYDAVGRVIEQRDGDNKLWSFAYDEPDHKTLVTDPLNRTTTYEYDAEWRLIRQLDPLNQVMAYSYDSDGNQVSVRDKRGYTTTSTYDERGNTLVITNTMGDVTQLAYDGWNNLTRQTDALAHTTVFTYDVNSNLIQSMDTLGHITTWGYNGFGQLQSSTNARGYTTLYNYNANGYQLDQTDALNRTTSFTYDDGGRLLTETDALNRVTTYTYDNANRLLTVAEPLGRVTAYGYDAVGNRVTITDARGGVSIFAYDAKDRLIAATDPLSRTTIYAYDAVDNQISVTDPLSHTTTYGYDALNRQATATDALNYVATTQYDANNNILAVTDANNHATHYAYDALNRLTQVTDAESGIVTYGYDAVGNRTSVTDGNNHTTTYTYDALNRLQSTTDPLNYVMSYSYDAVGNQATVTKADNTVIVYSYDALDHLVATTAPDVTIAYSYNAVGNRSRMTDTVGVTIYSYDDLDRLITVIQPTGTLSYSYDLNDNRTALTYPNGKVVTYTYDLANQMSKVVDHEVGTTAYTYDQAGRQSQVLFPNGVQQVNGYDNANRLLSIVHTSPISGVIATATYILDAVGNRLSMIDLDGSTSYLYDDLNRLTQVTYPNGEQVNYSYDAMGNRLTMVSTLHGTTIYGYDAGDRLLSYTDTSGTTTMAWDANGNMTGKGATTFDFDTLGHLTGVMSGTTTVQYSYNGDGVRLGKDVNGSATSYVQDVNSPLPGVVAEETGGQTIVYIYGLDVIAQDSQADGIALYHTDGLGSTRRLTDLTGAAIERYAYNAFGALGQSTDSSQAFGFTGEQFEPELDLVYLRARYYDYELGRFISEDPFPAFASNTQGLNRYVYAQNNPVNLVDPSGEIAAFIVGGAVGAVVGFGGYALTTWATDGEWNWGHAAVATGGGAIVGAAMPLIAAGIASGAIAPTALGTTLGVKGSVALVGTELGLAVGFNKSILNQQLNGVDSSELKWGTAWREGAVDAAFGALSGYSAGASALSNNLLQPGGWSYQYDWGKLGKDVGKKLSSTLYKKLVNKYLYPDKVYAPEQSLGDVPSQQK